MDLPADTKIALISFLKADYIPVMYFNNLAPTDADASTTKSKEHMSLSKQFIKQMSHLSGRASHSEDTTAPTPNPMVVQVSRNDADGSVKFDVSVRVLDIQFVSHWRCYAWRVFILFAAA